MTMHPDLLRPQIEEIEDPTNMLDNDPEFQEWLNDHLEDDKSFINRLNEQFDD